ncbi:MAG TPA: S1 RNA-binding domain-containing protein [Candidatus Nanoarchaeia archaeon]|nr:S1 RNA-binding domain-containing protein [Candidatus Nanoarchaeia archaeon]
MLYSQKGFPEQDEILLCKVTKMFPNSVFVDLLEYENKQGMIHISEIAPGRIRNLREYVAPDRQIVCKVLRIDREKGHIDLSLRRVNSSERRGKLDEIKQELKAEQLLKNLAKKFGKPVEELYKKLQESILQEYAYLHPCFKEVATGGADLEKLGVEKKLAQELTAAILEKFKPPKVLLQGEITLHSYASDGVERVKTLLTDIEKSSPTIGIFYLGGGRFKLTIEDVDYKAAEKMLARVQERLEKFNDKSSTAVFEREKKE